MCVNQNDSDNATRLLLPPTDRCQILLELVCHNDWHWLLIKSTRSSLLTVA